MSRLESAPTVPRSSATANQTPMRADWRNGYATAILIGVLVLGFVVLTPNIYFGGNSWLTLAFVAAYALVGAAVAWRGTLAIKLVSSCIILGASGIAAILAAGAPANGTFFFIALITVLTLLSSPRAGAVATAVSILVVGTLAFLSAADLLATEPTNVALRAPAGWIGMALAILLFGAALVLGIRHLRASGEPAPEVTALPRREPRGEPTGRLAREEQHANGAVWLTKALELGREMAAAGQLGDLTVRLAKSIQQAFGYSQVEVWIVDEARERLSLITQAGEDLAELPGDRESLPLDSDALPARAVRSRVVQTSSASGQSAGNGKALEDDGSVAAFPIQQDGDSFACLVTRTLARTGFEADELTVLEWAAGEAAKVFAQARLHTQSPGSLDRPAATRPKAQPEPWVPLAAEGGLEYETGEQELPESAVRMSVPLALRDEEIGTISLAADGEWSAEDKSLVEAVATQAALALENARLMEASRLAAAREHVLADITAKVLTSPTVDGVLRTAVQELAQALGADRAIIELQAEEESGE